MFAYQKLVVFFFYKYISIYSSETQDVLYDWGGVVGIENIFW